MTLVGVQDFLFRGRQGLRPQEILCSGGLALANDLTVAFPTPQRRQPFEDQGKQVCRTPRKHALATLSDVVFRAVAISRRNSRRGMFRADAQHGPTGAKARSNLGLGAARMNSCPDTKPPSAARMTFRDRRAGSFQLENGNQELEIGKGRRYGRGPRR